MSKAWITQETVDQNGKRKRCKAGPGTEGVPDDARFVVEWIDPDGKRRREKIAPAGKPGKRLADKRADKITAELITGTYGDKSKKTWKDFRAEYEENGLVGLSAGTRRQVGIWLNHFETTIKPNFKRNITPNTIAEFSAKRAAQPKRKGSTDKVSPSTVNRDLRHLKAALRKAHRWGYVTKPVIVDFLREIEKLPTYVSPEDFERIYKTCKTAARFPADVPNVKPAEWWRALIVFVYTTGWRIGQTLELAWADVDLEAETVITRGDDNKGKRDKKVPLPNVTVEHLHKLQGSFSPAVFPWMHDNRTLWCHFQEIQAAAKVKPDGGIDYYGFHDLRRAFATLNEDRLSAMELQAMMQHQSFETTRRYINMGRQLKVTASKVYVPSLPSDDPETATEAG